MSGAAPLGSRDCRRCAVYNSLSAAEEARWAEWQLLHDGLAQSLRADVHELIDQMRDVKLTLGGIEESLKEMEMCIQELKEDVKKGKTILASRPPW